MATAIIDGIQTRYEVVGSGPPVLMFSPGGFDGVLEKWTTTGTYAKTRLIAHLSRKYSCIVFDRRETGQSGGRVERVTWADYAAQGRGLLEHLRIQRAHLMGGCMGCSPVLSLVVSHPEVAMSLVLWWPVGGAKYRINSQSRFAQHLAYVQSNGLAEVVALAKSSGKSFSEDPRVGPWASVLRLDRGFAESYAKQDVERYKLIVAGMARALMDRDTAPGPEPEDLLRPDIPARIVPGRDPSHATSAARYLEECLPKAQYWDVPPDGQTEQSAPARLLQFLESVTGAGSVFPC